MSSPVQPARPDAASMTAIRGLLERNLVERAAALAETRWPGSGPVVELAHEWAVLSPSARRERLASIGPEELSRLRGVASIQPDLERVLNDLEARGIIPPEHATDAVEALPAEATAPTFEEAAVDAALDYSEQGLQRLASSVREDLPPNLEAAMASATNAQTVAELAEAAAAIARERAKLDPVEPISMPQLDLGLPSAEEFLAEEAERRQQATELASGILERARTRVDAAAASLMPAVDPVAIATPPADATETTAEPELAEPVTQAESTRVDSAMQTELRDRIERERVLSVEPGSVVPTAAELESVATASSRSYVALYPREMGARAFFGGLVREGSGVEPRAGSFPLAVSSPSLVAVHGRLYPKTLERLREGYCDIPGTQATVRLHPDCRIVVLPE